MINVWWIQTVLHLTTFLEGVETSFQGIISTVSKTFKFPSPELIHKPPEFREIHKFLRKNTYFFSLGNSSSRGKGHKIASFHLLLIWYKGKNNMPRYLLLKSCYKNTLRWKRVRWVTVCHWLPMIKGRYICNLGEPHQRLHQAVR